jgi:crossover junction endodeoxyribonuclease RuvC
MITLGIDPGLQRAGYALCDLNGGRIALLACDVIKLPSSENISARLGMLHARLTELIIQYNVGQVALETPFLGKNAANFLKLGYVRGIIHLLAHTHSLKLVEYAPTEIKQAITGYGAADKEQVAAVLLRLFPGMVKPKYADATDALAVALCGIWRR